MLQHDKLFIGGDWVAPAGTGDHRRHLAAHRRGRRPRARRDRPPTWTARSPPPASAFDDGPWPRMTPAERIAIVSRLAELYAGTHDGDGRAHHRRDGLADLVLAAGAGARAVDDDQLRSSSSRRTSRGRSAPGHARHRCSCAASRSASSPAIVPWNVPQFVTMSKLAPALLVRLHDRPEARARDAARRATCWPSCSTRPASRGRRQRRARRPRGRRAPRAPPRRRQGRVHRLDRGRAAASPRSAASSSSACSLELGGKSAAIILDDADLDADDGRPASSPR